MFGSIEFTQGYQTGQGQGHCLSEDYSQGQNNVITTGKGNKLKT